MGKTNSALETKTNPDLNRPLNQRLTKISTTIRSVNKNRNSPDKSCSPELECLSITFDGHSIGVISGVDFARLCDIIRSPAL